MIRELLEQEDWQSYHIDGKVMTADVGTKALPADRFGLLVGRMINMRRFRATVETSSGVDPKIAKKLVLVLCMAALVERADGAHPEANEAPGMDYLFVSVCVVAVIAVWECIKGMLESVAQTCCRGRRRSRAETSLSRSSDPSGPDDRQEVDSPEISPSAESLRSRSRSRFTGERRPATPPIPTTTTLPTEPCVENLPTGGAYGFKDPSGKRDRWEWDVANGRVIRWHPNARVQLFVPGQTSGGPTQDQLTGERQTFARFANGEVRVHRDNYKKMSKPAQTLADREWRGRTELRLNPSATEPAARS